MSNEANTLRIIERVAADTRRDTISSNDIWNMSIKKSTRRIITFWISSYVHVMKQETTSWFKSLVSDWDVSRTHHVHLLTVILVLT
jgi:hypothetical protein